MKNTKKEFRFNFHILIKLMKLVKIPLMIENYKYKLIGTL